jgi:LPXTG-motif cell wall-anchored protein
MLKFVTQFHVILSIVYFLLGVLFLFSPNTNNDTTLLQIIIGLVFVVVGIALFISKKTI